MEPTSTTNEVNSLPVVLLLRILGHVDRTRWRNWLENTCTYVVREHITKITKFLLSLYLLVRCWAPAEKRSP